MAELGQESCPIKLRTLVRRISQVALYRYDHCLKAIDALLVALKSLREGLQFVVRLAVAATKTIVVHRESPDLRRKRAPLADDPL